MFLFCFFFFFGLTGHLNAVHLPSPTMTPNNIPRAQATRFDTLFGPQVSIFHFFFMSSNIIIICIFNWLPHPGASTFTHNNTSRAQKMCFDALFGPQVSIFFFIYILYMF